MFSSARTCTQMMTSALRNFIQDFSVSENGNVVEYNGEKSIFGADLITRKAVDYISEKRDEPFMLTMAYYNPHSPYFWAERHDPQFRRTGSIASRALPSAKFHGRGCQRQAAISTGFESDLC